MLNGVYPCDLDDSLLHVWLLCPPSYLRPLINDHPCTRGEQAQGEKPLSEAMQGWYSHLCRRYNDHVKQSIIRASILLTQLLCTVASLVASA